VLKVLLDGQKVRKEKDKKKIYFSESQMQQNNFWTSRPLEEVEG